MRLSFTLVDNWIDACHLMRIRNACRDGFTHFKGEITTEMQHKFFHEQLEPGLKAAYLLRDNREPVGFGLLDFHAFPSHHTSMTIGVAPAFRGRGFSYVLTELITAMGHAHGGDVWLDVDRSAFVRHVYAACGYEVVVEETLSGLTVMKNRKPVRVRMEVKA